MARPRKSADQRQIMRIKVYCCKAEASEIRRRAQRRRCAVSEYLRRCALGRRLPSATPPRNLLARFQLWRVKSNATQIRQALDAGRIAPIPRDRLQRLSARTETLRERLRQSPPRVEARHHALTQTGRVALALRVNRAERAVIAARARRAGLSLSAFARRKALGRRMPARIPELPKPLFDALFRTQRQWNAIAHAVNAGKTRVVDGAIFDRFDQLYDEAFRVLS